MENVIDLEHIERTVQDAREYAESIVNTVREPLMVLDADLKVVSANRTFYQTFKTKPEETEGQLIYDIGNQQWNIPKLRELLEEILPKNASFDNFEVNHDFPHLGKRTMLLNARRIPQPPARPRIILLAIEDITERKQVEALRASEVRYRLLFESAKDGIMILDSETGIIVDTNPFLAEMLGYSKEQLLGKTIWEIGMTKDIASNKDKFMELQKQECIRYEDLPLKTAGGQRIDVEFVSNVFVVDHQKVVRCHIRDITARKILEAKLRAVSHYTRSLIETSLDSLVTISPNGIITDLNAATEQVTGVSREKLIGNDFSDYFTEPDKAREGYKQVFSKGAVRDYPLTIRHSSGRVTDVLYNAALYKNEAGEIQGVFAAARDVTERKQAEHKLNEAYQKIKTHTQELEMINENLDSFAYSVSHDLRAPLRAISGFSQVLIDTQGDKVNEEMRHYLYRINEGAQKMGQLIDDLLSFSRATRSEIKYEKINVQNIVNDLVKAYRDVEPDRDIEFIVNPLGEVKADKEMLKIVFSNLLQNAIKFTIDRETARIEIGSEQKEDFIQFYVKDNGIGFDMKYKDKLFKTFQRLQTDERFKGTGIGLTTVKRIVTKHGGNIWAKGEVDKGAEFFFTLPSKTHVEDLINNVK
jgi:PAS domain S-box-containing protein